MTHPHRLDRIALALMILPIAAIVYGCVTQIDAVTFLATCAIVAGVVVWVWNGREIGRAHV